MSFLKITDPAKRDAIVRDFLKTKENIYKQSQQERLADASSELEAAKYFKPVIQSQQQLAQDIVGTQEKFIRALEQAPPQQALPSGSSDTQVYGPIVARNLLRALGKDPDRDLTFGLRADDGKYYIGDKEVGIEGDDLVIGDRLYKGTKGLWELIRSKNPDSTRYTDNDLDEYRKILLQTNAMYHDYDPSRRVNSSRSVKYNNIIKPIYESTRRGRKTPDRMLKGSGTVFLSQDPNVLIHRLSLLMASQQAGNTAGTNEMVSILDELLKQKYITKEDYKRVSTKIK